MKKKIVEEKIYSFFFSVCISNGYRLYLTARIFFFFTAKNKLREKRTENEMEKAHRTAWTHKRCDNELFWCVMCKQQVVNSHVPFHFIASFVFMACSLSLSFLFEIIHAHVTKNSSYFLFFSFFIISILGHRKWQMSSDWCVRYVKIIKLHVLS